MSDAAVDVPIVRVRDGVRTDAVDVAAEEAALEIRVDGSPYGVLMRTPGDDRRLTAGFLLSERLISGADDLALIEHCKDESGHHDERRNPDESRSHPSESQAADLSIVRVTLASAASERAVAIRAARRETMASAACGVCGRVSVDSLCEGLSPLDTSSRVAASLVEKLPEHLRRHQPVFTSTGGLHAAALFDSAGTVLAVAEDVGRHNAVDKVLGDRVLREQLPIRDGVLCVSGRTSFEIVQKAWCAGVPIVAAVSAPTSLAVALASRAGITLIGFVRSASFNIYTRPDRIV